MKDELKIFIENNREGFKETPPADLWGHIENGLKQNNTSTSSVTELKTKNISTMLKYGFGASVLIVGTFAILNLTKEKTQTSQLNSPVPDTVIELTESPVKNEIPVPSTLPKKEIVTKATPELKNSPDPIAVMEPTKALPLPEINSRTTTPNPLPANKKVALPDTLDVTAWRAMGSAIESYTFFGDYTTGKNIGVIRSVAKKINGFGGFMLSTMPDEYNGQSSLLEKYLGKRVRLTGYIKTENLSEWVGLWLRVGMKGGDEALGFDNMRYGKKDRSIKGTTPWTKYEIVLDVPMNASNIIYGVMIAGTGEMRFHTPVLEIVDTSVPVTADISNAYPGISGGDRFRSYHPTDFWKWYVPGRVILKDGTSQVNYAE